MTAIIILDSAALALGRRLCDQLPGAMLHGLAGRAPADIAFTDTASHLRRLFAEGEPIIGLCAAGILIRALAPLLTDKRAEPAVLAVARDGSAVVPLLGGHHGANQLARHLAQALGGKAAITTAGDLSLGVALDEPPRGWRAANPESAKALAARLLAGKAVRIEIETGEADWLSGLKTDDAAPLSIRVSERAFQPDEGELVLHPQVLALGVGCERGVPAEELEAHARAVLDAQDLAAGAVACVVSLDLKADEPAVHALARGLGVPVRFFSAKELESQAERLVHPSETVFAETGCHGVAEGAALAAAGPGGMLIVPKDKGARSTIAVARATHPIDADSVGRAQGRLFIVGIGPGRDDWRTPEASRALALSSDLVGYGLYLDLLGEAVGGKSRHESDLGAESARARKALDLAAAGKVVALVCSGDAGIYALATLVFELIEQENRPEWNRLAIEVCPGVSAMQAAAAKAGAPLNHDFCAISLSDLLTPWAAIEKRVRAAAAGDFVVCFYNPVSKRRRDQLARARDLLLEGGRPAGAPVVLARQLGRPEEQIRLTTLGELTPEDADMLTLVLVGSSETRAFTAGERRWVYTPRGYAGKGR